MEFETKIGHGGCLGVANMFLPTRPFTAPNTHVLVPALHFNGFSYRDT